MIVSLSPRCAVFCSLTILNYSMLKFSLPVTQVVSLATNGQFFNHILLIGQYLLGMKVIFLLNLPPPSFRNCFIFILDNKLASLFCFVLTCQAKTLQFLIIPVKTINLISTMQFLQDEEKLLIMLTTSSLSQKTIYNSPVHKVLHPELRTGCNCI